MADPTNFIVCNAGLAKLGELAFQGASIAAGGTLRLCAGTNLIATSVGGDVAANEVSGGGYAPFPLSVASNSLNATFGTQDIVFSAVNFTPTADVSFQQAAVLMSDGTLFGVFNWDAPELMESGRPYKFPAPTIPFGGEGTDVSPQP